MSSCELGAIRKMDTVLSNLESVDMVISPIRIHYSGDRPVEVLEGRDWIRLYVRHAPRQTTPTGVHISVPHLGAEELCKIENLFLLFLGFLELQPSVL